MNPPIASRITSDFHFATFANTSQSLPHQKQFFAVGCPLEEKITSGIHTRTIHNGHKHLVFRMFGVDQFLLAAAAQHK